MTDLPPASAPAPGVRRRVSPRVAVALLETLRSQDLPGEVLADEDLTYTLPRRLGLSEVVEAQIRRYRDDVRRRRRVSDEEILDLMRLVLRRPDARVLFRRVGEELSGVRSRPGGWRRWMPRTLALRLGQRRVKRRLRFLFGRSVVRADAGPDTLMAETELFLTADPGEAAAELVSGLAGSILTAYTGREVTVRPRTVAKDDSGVGLTWDLTVPPG